MKRPKALSLVEMLVVMSAVSVLLNLTALVLHRLMDVHSHSRAFLDTERNALRLARQARSDIHAAQRVEVERGETGDTLRLELGPAGSVEYRNDGELVQRVCTRTAAMTARESYRFDPGERLKIEWLESPKRIALTVGGGAPAQQESASESSADSPPAERLRVEVCPGLREAEL